MTMPLGLTEAGEGATTTLRPPKSGRGVCIEFFNPLRKAHTVDNNKVIEQLGWDFGDKHYRPLVNELVRPLLGNMIHDFIKDTGTEMSLEELSAILEHETITFIRAYAKGIVARAMKQNKRISNCIDPDPTLN